MKISDPIVFEVLERDDFLTDFEKNVKEQFGDEKAGYLLAYPSVYIHEWKKETNNPNGLFDVYVGESNDIVKRTNEHFRDAKKKNKWQRHLLNDGVYPTLFVIGHKHFNKSLTLDIENKLINYIYSMDNIRKVHNSRGNPQNEYYPQEEFSEIFNKIWRCLHKKNQDLFLPESQITNSAIYKASPLHNLTQEQLGAKNSIISRVVDAVSNNKTNQLVFVIGEAGTGKTVLMSSTFYELLLRQEELFGKNKKLKCSLLVNHDEQLTVYKEIAKRLNLTEEFGDEIVSKPTHFINSHSPDDLMDVVFVDEGHLLLTRGKQSYRGNNHLEDIMKRSRVTVLVFDENQILTAEQFWEEHLLILKMDISFRQNNLIKLNKQMRMQCNEKTQKFIDNLTLNQRIIKLPHDDKYDIEVFDSPKDLFKKIKEKSKRKKTKLSRMLATYDWEYNKSSHPANGDKYWGVKIDNFFMPWNRELSRFLTRKEKYDQKTKAWAEQEQTINEIGSTFTIQGFDLNYAGVIIGPSVKYKNGKIVFDPSKSKNLGAISKRTLSDGTKKDFSETLLKHELRVLLTRGVNGLYLYACDKELNNALKKAVYHNKKN